MTREQYEQAQQAGCYARQAGRKLDACPLFAMGKDGDLLREAWRQGWQDEDARRAGRKA